MHKKMCSGVIFLRSMNQTLLWCGSRRMNSLLHSNEYLDNKIHDIHAVQGLGWINEMMVHIKKTYANIKA